MAYASESLSLAAIEVFVHVDAEDEATDLHAVVADIPVEPLWLEQRKRDILAELSPWDRADLLASQSIGDAWVQSLQSLVLPVPSAVIDGEWNALVNPTHPDAGRIIVVESKPFRFDSRMFKPSQDK